MSYAVAVLREVALNDPAYLAEVQLHRSVNSHLDQCSSLCQHLNLLFECGQTSAHLV